MTTELRALSGFLSMKRFNATKNPRLSSLTALLLCLFALPTSQSWGQLPDNNDSLDRATRRMREAVQRIVVPSTALTNGPHIRKIFEEVMVEPNAWTARVKCDGNNAALGIVVTPQGHILTKASELTEHITCRLHDGRELAAELVGSKPEFDLAVIKVEADSLDVVEWEDNLLNLGQWLATPDQGKLPASIGVLSVMARNIPK